jgi:homoserine dehydrogenase
MRVIILGMGSVASGLCHLISDRQRELKLMGLDLVVVSVVDSAGVAMDSEGLDLHKLLEVKKLLGTVARYPNAGKLGVGSKEVIESLNADLVVDLTPTNLVDGQPSLSNIRRSLRLGMNVVTANKGPLALEMPILMDLAKLNGVALKFSATVGGATPFLSFAHDCLGGDEIMGIEAILNGTSNFILSQMENKNGASFEEALLEAQKLGYAETDPSLDVDGLDTAAKLVILANWSMNRRFTLKDAKVKGIRDVRGQQIESAKSRNRRIRLVGKIGIEAKGKEIVSVNPAELEVDDPLCVQGTLNAVRFKTKLAGNLTLIGAGAGGDETASAILRDILEIKKLNQRSNGEN